MASKFDLPEPKDSEIFTSFDDCPIPEELLRGIYSYGFEKPSIVQQRAILPLLQGRHVICQAKSGTGAMSAAVIGALGRIDTSRMKCQFVMLVATRELSQGSQWVVSQLGKFLNVTTLALHGGVSPRDHIRALEAAVVGTPGRMTDFINRGLLNFGELRSMVVYDGDELLSRGFGHQIHQILESIPASTQLVCSAATLPPDLLELVHPHMVDPVEIVIKEDTVELENFHHYYVTCDREEWKPDFIADLADAFPFPRIVIFANTRRKADWLHDQLARRELQTEVLHADVSHKEYDDGIQRVREGRSRVVLSTSLLRPSSFVPGPAIIVHYDLPTNREDYLHRLWVRDREGNKITVVISLVPDSGVRLHRQVLASYDITVEEMPESAVITALLTPTVVG